MFLTCPTSIILVDNNDRDFGCRGGTHCGSVCTRWYYLFLCSKSRHVVFWIDLWVLILFLIFVLCTLVVFMSSFLDAISSGQPSMILLSHPSKENPNTSTSPDRHGADAKQRKGLRFVARAAATIEGWWIRNLEFKPSGSFFWRATRAVATSLKRILLLFPLLF